MPMPTDKPLSMLDVISPNRTHHRRVVQDCPFCGHEIELPTRVAGRYIVGCDNCAENGGAVQFSGATPEEAMEKWNSRTGKATPHDR